jgi:hypothetical protein
MQTVTLLPNNPGYAVVTFAENPGWLFVANVTNPATPVFVSPSTNYVYINNAPNGVKLYNNTVYTVCNTGRLYIIDVTNPTAIALLGSLLVVGTGTTQLWNVDVAPFGTGFRAYVTSTSAANGLYVVDVTTPSSPAVVNSGAAGVVGTGVKVSGNYAYIGNYSSSNVSVYDISVVTTGVPPTYLTNVAVSSAPSGMLLHPTAPVLYVTAYSTDTLWVLNLTTPTVPTLANTITFTGSAATNFGSIRVANNLLYVGAINGYINIYDQANPLAPNFIKVFNTGIGSLMQFDVDGNNNLYIPNRSPSPNALQVYVAGTCATFFENIMAATYYNASGTPVGLTGATGPVGGVGSTGAAGGVGSTGAAGGVGATGAAGGVGATGATGDQGSTGNDGATGDQGSTGNDGATGDQGSTGNDGATGDQGSTGNDGATGAPPTLSYFSPSSISTSNLLGSPTATLTHLQTFAITGTVTGAPLSVTFSGTLSVVPAGPVVFTGTGNDGSLLGARITGTSVSGSSFTVTFSAASAMVGTWQFNFDVYA